MREHMKSHRVSFKVIAALCLLSLTLGCSVTKQSEIDADKQGKNRAADFVAPTLQKTCSEPRPGVCTMIYAPVCGFDASGNSKQYASGCVACSDPNVIGYNEGSCVSGPGSD
ncbi:MAG: hypothetical protein P8N51_07190 [Pseudomonadales bacterium]|nr:hypothetical protein [Pseudomonadales bacterium]MDG1443829.1 hypothetical protein [Pseudomonadales bacterium]